MGPASNQPPPSRSPSPCFAHICCENSAKKIAIRRPPHYRYGGHVPASRSEGLRRLVPGTCPATTVDPRHRHVHPVMVPARGLSDCAEIYPLRCRRLCRRRDIWPYMSHGAPFWLWRMAAL